MSHKHYVTCWYRDDPEKPDLEFNHISIGFHTSAVRPLPINESQALAWRNVRWVKRCAIMRKGVVYENIPQPGVIVHKPSEPRMQWI